MKKLLVASLFAFVSITAQADLLKFTPGSLELSDVNLNKSAVVLDQKGQPTATQVELLGAGVRNKIMLIKIPVYVAQLFSNAKAGYVRDEEQALSSLTTSATTVVLKISMLRDVDAATLAESFSDALAANDLNVEEGELHDVLSIIENAADADEGTEIVMLMQKNTDGSVTLSMQDASGDVKSYTGSQALMHDIMSIWLGVPADKGLEKLKSTLLNPVY